MLVEHFSIAGGNGDEEENIALITPAFPPTCRSGSMRQDGIGDRRHFLLSGVPRLLVPGVSDFRDREPFVLGNRTQFPLQIGKLLLDFWPLLTKLCQRLLQPLGKGGKRKGGSWEGREGGRGEGWDGGGRKVGRAEEKEWEGRDGGSGEGWEGGSGEGCEVMGNGEWCEVVGKGVR